MASFVEVFDFFRILYLLFLIRGPKYLKVIILDYFIVLYLLLTPFPNHGLEINLSNGLTISTNDLDSDSILVLMGRGLTDWLLQQNSNKNLFYPTQVVIFGQGQMKTKNLISKCTVYL